MTTNAGRSPPPCNASSPVRRCDRREKLDITALAEEAGVKRNKLTHKHTDLKDLFYAQRQAVTPSRTTKSRYANKSPHWRTPTTCLREERDRYRTTSETFARALHVLTNENESLRHTLDDTVNVTALPHPPKR